MPDVKYEFVRGNSSGIDGTSLKDGQILFDKQKKTISLDATVNGTLTRINMSGDNTFNGTAAEWEALTDAQRAAYKYVYITDDYEVISKEMEGASATTNGVTGLVPQPIAGDQDKVLYGDGTWKEASTFSGDYDDLTNKPTLGTASEKDSTSAITEDSTDLVESGAVYDALTDKVDASDLADVATSGNYEDLINTPTLGTAAAADTTDSVIENSTDVLTSGGAYTALANIDTMISGIASGLDWKEAVATFDDIATTYPNPDDGWTVNVKDTDYTYRYDGSHWVAISANAIPNATTSVNGLMTTTQVTKLNGIATGAEVNVQSDWNVTDNTSDAFIKNKPTIPTYTAGTGIDVTNNVVSTKQSVSGDIDEIVDQLPPGGAGISYADVSGKPTINGVTLVGNQSAADFGLASSSQYQALTNYTADTGVKNFLKNEITTTSTDGMTFTKNADGTITTGGSNTSQSTKNIFLTPTAGTTFKKGTYILNGCPSGANGFGLFLISTQGSIGGIYDRGNGIEFTLATDVTDLIVTINVDAGKSINGLTFKPMIREATITDPTYQPYAKTNVELTQDVAGIEGLLANAIGKEITAATAWSDLENMGTYVMNGVPFTGNWSIVLVLKRNENTGVQIAFRVGNASDVSSSYVAYRMYYTGTWSSWAVVNATNQA